MNRKFWLKSYITGILSVFGEHYPISNISDGLIFIIKTELKIEYIVKHEHCNIVKLT